MFEEELLSGVQVHSSSEQVEIFILTGLYSVCCPPCDHRMNSPRRESGSGKTSAREDEKGFFMFFMREVRTFIFDVFSLQGSEVRGQRSELQQVSEPEGPQLLSAGTDQFNWHDCLGGHVEVPVGSECKE